MDHRQASSAQSQKHPPKTHTVYQNYRALPIENQRAPKWMVPMGLFLRMVPAYCLVTGLYLFTDNAFGIASTKPILTILIAFFIALSMLMRWNTVIRIIGSIITGGGFLGIFLFFGGMQPLTFLANMAKSFFNTAISYMMKIGYGTLYVFQADTELSAEAEASYAKLFFTCISVLTAMIIGTCCAKKVKIWPMALIVAVDYFVIFMYNISTSKWGFALSLTGIAGILCMKMTEYGKLPQKTQAAISEHTPSTLHGYAYGGLLAAFSSLLVFLAVCIPAAKVKNIWKTYDPIDTVMETIRAYEIALITGEDMQLTDLGLTGAAEILEARSSLATPRYFTGKQVLEIQSNVNQPLYLRSWISTTFDEDRWYVANEQQRSEYSAVFHNTFRAEDLTYWFYNAINERLVRYNSKTSYADHQNDGYITTLISLKNLGVAGNILFLPSRFDSSRSLLEYGTIDTAYRKKWINYFDGIAYSRAFHKGARYSAVTYLPLFKEENWEYNLNEKLYAYRDFLSMYKYLGEALQKYYIDDFIDASSGSMRRLLDNYASLDTEQLAAFEETVEMVDTYNDYVMESSIYTSMTDDPALNERLSALAKEIICKDPLPMTGIQVDAVYGTAEETVDFTNSVWELCQNAAPDTEILHREKLLSEDGETATYRYYIRDYDAFVNTIGTENLSYYAAAFAKRIAKYLSESMTYTLTPTVAEPDDPMSSAERFLFVTKEGYCVQYATAATLMLRALGIPARYVEGYIAPKFSRNQPERPENKIGHYICYVRDYNAHAWVEIFLPHYGWLTTEVTTPYYSNLYDPYEQTDYTYRPSSNAPIGETAPLPETEDDDDDTFWDIYGAAILSIGIFILTSAGILYVSIKFLSYQNQKHIRHITDLKQAAAGEFSQEGQRRAVSSALYDHMRQLLWYFRLKPVTGETPASFVQRIDMRFPFTETAAVNILPVIEKNEFGSTGITHEELADFASYLFQLEARIKDSCNPFQRFWITYFRGLL